jgi:hypothetical protein
MLEAVKMPEHDRFQIILERPKDKLVADENYLNIRRTGDAVFVEITQFTNAGLRKEDSLIVLTENDAADWWFGMAEAQYAK